jgi:aldehyde dehydrogenase (NAD+)
MTDMQAWHERAGAFFAGGATRPIAFRVEQLQKLAAAVRDREKDLLAALAQDLGKPTTEAYLAEIGWVLNDIRHALRHVKAWSRPRRGRFPVAVAPSRGVVYAEPRGLVLIMAPWNYPLQLLFSPLVAAMAAGNAVALKPSEMTPGVSRQIAALLGDTFPTDYIRVWEGDREVAESLLRLRFDHIFFTGSTAVGRRVMAAAAAFPTSVTLELGGKSPCIVCADADLRVTARRIAWGKFMNAGQVCVAPDYVLVERAVCDGLIAELRKAITEFYGAHPSESPHFGRLVNRRHAERLQGLLQGQNIVLGGACDAETRYMAPTLLLDPAPDSAVMREEIFGPVLPIIPVADLDGALREVNRRPPPLALYAFTRRRDVQDRIRQATVSGGVTFNDTVVHIFGHSLPFGGIGESGLGAYHGQAGFDTFSHRRTVATRPFRPDFSFRYPPFRAPLRVLRQINRFLMG